MESHTVLRALRVSHENSNSLAIRGRARSSGSHTGPPVQLGRHPLRPFSFASGEPEDRGNFSWKLCGEYPLWLSEYLLPFVSLVLLLRVFLL